MSADVGSKAPDFTLMNQDREPVSLSAERGHPVVLAFFPAAFSGVCTGELCAMRDDFPEVTRDDVELLTDEILSPGRMTTIVLSGRGAEDPLRKSRSG